MDELAHETPMLRKEGNRSQTCHNKSTKIEIALDYS